MSGMEGFLDELASSSPVPGGGSVAALQVAMGAALLVMVCDLTIGKKRYAQVEERVREIRAAADSLRRQAQHLVDEDADAYSKVSEVLALPKATDEERARRSQHMQEALKGAAGPPLDTMRSGRQVIELASALAPIGNRSAVSDVGSAAVAAWAGFQAAELNVEINVASVRDENWVEATRGQVTDLGDLQTLVAETMSVVRSVIRGDG